jgi:hypothetical protein
MKLLLDECVTNYLKDDFIGHEVSTVEEAAVQRNNKWRVAAAGIGPLRCIDNGGSKFTVSAKPQEFCDRRHRLEGKPEYISYVAAARIQSSRSTTNDKTG